MAEQGIDSKIELTLEGVNELLAQLKIQIEKLNDPQGLVAFRQKWLSKDGEIKKCFKGLGAIPADKKVECAQLLNQLKSQAETAVEEFESELKLRQIAEKLRSEQVDLTLPGRSSGLGAVHPISAVEAKVMELLRPFGFRAVFGPELETEYYCFDSLNIPKHHPARDMQDTFYTETGHVVRTHTTSVQARELEKGALPVKVCSYGRVYRNETEDASHSAMFHQFELVWIDKGLTLANLMAILSHILKSLYGKRRKVRFVPKFYPYTEPSIGAQIDCEFCKSAGCPACGGSGWVTIVGAGMVHKNVLKEFKYDSSEVSGFAFGFGTSRLASQFSGLPTMRELYANEFYLLKAVVGRYA